jgi:hypothetical protein
MKIDHSRFLPMKKLIGAVAAIPVARQDDALQTLGKPLPPGNNLNERLQIPLGNHVAESAPWRFTVEDVSPVYCHLTAVFALNTPSLDLRRGASIERGGHSQ